jgi:hypothetical protein
MFTPLLRSSHFYEVAVFMNAHIGAAPSCSRSFLLLLLFSPLASLPCIQLWRAACRRGCSPRKSLCSRATSWLPSAPRGNGTPTGWCRNAQLMVLTFLCLQGVGREDPRQVLPASEQAVSDHPQRSVRGTDGTDPLTALPGSTFLFCVRSHNL